MMKKLVVAFTIFLIGCAEADYTELRSEARQQEARLAWIGPAPEKLYDLLFDKFGGSRQMIFGTKGEIAEGEKEIFLRFVRKMPRSALFDESKPEFIFVLERRWASTKGRKGGHFIVGEKSARIVGMEVTLKIIAARKTSKGNQEILRRSAKGYCYKGEVIVSDPPNCKYKLKELTILNLESIGAMLSL